MEESQSSVVAGLIGAAAVGLFFALPLDTFRWGSTLAGLTILLVLLAHVSLRSTFQSLAHGAVCGLALMLLLRPVLANVATPSELQVWFTAVWIIGAVVFTFVDRSRVAAAWAAQSVQLPQPHAVPTNQGLGLLATPAPAPAAVVPTPPPPPAVAHLTFEAPIPEPVAVVPPPPPAAAPVPPVVAAPPQPAAAPLPPTPPPAAPTRIPLWAAGAIAVHSSHEPEATPRPVSFPTPVAAPPPPPPAPPAPLQAPVQATASYAAPASIAFSDTPQPLAPLRPGAEITTIYVDMTSGGYSCLRGVQAEHITRDIYRILEPMPAGEEWKYPPGQVVRCKKEKLSTGKAMVAVQEVQLQQVS